VTLEINKLQDSEFFRKFQRDLMGGKKIVCTYDFYSPVHNVLGSKWHSDAISQGPKNSGIPGPNPLPLPQVMYMHPSKTLCTGLYKSQVHRLFYAHEPPGDFNAV